MNYLWNMFCGKFSRHMRASWDRISLRRSLICIHLRVFMAGLRDILIRIRCGESLLPRACTLVWIRMKPRHTYSLLQYTEIAHGIAYPVGGFQTERQSFNPFRHCDWLPQVLQALADVGKRMGVNYLFNSPVSSVILSKDQKPVESVKLENGKELRADLVVINADLVYAYNSLLPPPKYARSLKHSRCIM